MQVSNNFVLGWKRGMMAQVGARVLGRGLVKQWHRDVCMKMASTALIFSALQPVRPALHLPLKQQVGLNRVARGNSSSLLLLQCASTDPSYGAINSVLLETKECADGSIMYKFGTAEQKEAMTVKDENLSPKKEYEGCEKLAEATVSDFEKLEGPLEDLQIRDEKNPRLTKQELQTVMEEVSSTPERVSTEVAQQVLEPESKEQVVISSKDNGVASKESLEEDIDSVKSPEAEKPTEVKSDEVKKLPSCNFISGAAMIPHPDKADRGGEDAYFIEGNHWIGVADGVGGWALEGVNAGHYARELMWHCAELARDSDSDSDPKSLLVKSFSRTKAMGSTTAVVASVRGQTLNVVNMGDTGFLVVRDGVAFARSTPMQRGFNFPYQIGSVGDDPYLAEVYNVPVEKGDVIILGSDGLFDNLFENQIVELVSKALKSASGPETVANVLAKSANKVGGSQEGMSPFAKEAQAVGYSYSGGKMDDITAVVSFVS